jgi:transcriptional regulator with XRE-family HTH domain
MRDRQPTVRARELGLTLAQAAQAKGLSNNELARRLAWSDSRISRLFSGKRNVNNADLAAILAICGIKPPKREELLELGRHALERGWWQEHGDRLPPEIITLSDYEDAANTIVCYETIVVPGLLQTTAYMSALMRQVPAIPAAELAVRIEARLKRQLVLDGYRPARFVFFLDGYTLTRVGAGMDIMSEQVHHLLRMAVRPHIEIRIIPDEIGFHAGQMPFQLMTFTELDPIVFIENETSVLFLERADTVGGYRRTVAHLDNVALDERRSREWLAALATDLGAPREEHDERDTPLEEEFPHQLG